MTGNARRRTYTEMFSAGPQHSSVMRHEGCLTTAVRRNQGSALPCWERRGPIAAQRFRQHSGPEGWLWPQDTC